MTLGVLAEGTGHTVSLDAISLGTIDLPKVPWMFVSYLMSDLFILPIEPLATWSSWTAYEGAKVQSAGYMNLRVVVELVLGLKSRSSAAQMRALKPVGLVADKDLLIVRLRRGPLGRDRSLHDTPLAIVRCYVRVYRACETYVRA